MGIVKNMGGHYRSVRMDNDELSDVEGVQDLGDGGDCVGAGDREVGDALAYWHEFEDQDVDVWILFYEVGEKRNVQPNSDL